MLLYDLYRRCRLLFVVWITCANLVLAQTATNGSLLFNQNNDSQLYFYQGGNAVNNTPLGVLISGRAGIDNQVLPGTADQYNFTGTLFLTTPNNVGDLVSGNIACVSCDTGDYDSSFISPSQVLDSAASRVAGNMTSPGAVLLYSQTSQWCSIIAQPAGALIFTMTSPSDSAQLLKLIDTSDNATVWIADRQFAMNNGSFTGTWPSGSSTTTIAMIVLYAVTGIITFLFLLVIVLGALRAHRHPERYGARNILGMPRQSRARGMARAMLDTIPIIKFGESEQPKPANSAEDLELGRRPAEQVHVPVLAAERSQMASQMEQTTEPSGNGLTSNEVGAATSVSDSTIARPPADVPGVQTVSVERKGLNETGSGDDSVQCPICTEDFVRGESARHLPCNHNFHPACIDPWLLNVSSTCPLCRVDLNPPDNDTQPDENGQEQENTVTPIQRQSGSSRWGRISRFGFLDMANMSRASREERIEALRQVRAAGQAHGADPSYRRRSRISRLFQNRQSQTSSEIEPAASSPTAITHATHSGQLSEQAASNST